MIVTFLGYVSGPSILSAPVTWMDGDQVPFIAVAEQLALIGAIQVIVLARRTRAVS